MPQDDILQNKRYSQIFKELVEEYVETGEPVGSRTLSKRLSNTLSPATIRNVMSDLEELGVICSEHTSSGRKPTEKGLRYFVDTFIEVSVDLQNDLSKEIEPIRELTDDLSVFERASEMLSQLSNCAGLIMTPTINDRIIEYIDFIHLTNTKILSVIVLKDGNIENRVIHTGENISTDTLLKATKQLNSKLCGHSLSELRTIISEEFVAEEKGLEMIASELESCVDPDRKNAGVIIKGHSNLLSNVEEIENIKNLFDKLDEKRTIKNLLDEAMNSKSIKVFIGAENKEFNLSGCSMIVAPYTNANKKIIGALGVIGPARMKYNKVVNLVDFTAKMLSRMM